MATRLDLYRAVRDGLKEPADIMIHFQVDEQRLEDALAPLRAAKILQIVSVVFGGGRFVECLPDARDESAAMNLAKAAGIDLSCEI